MQVRYILLEYRSNPSSHSPGTGCVLKDGRCGGNEEREQDTSREKYPGGIHSYHLFQGLRSIMDPASISAGLKAA